MRRLFWVCLLCGTLLQLNAAQAATTQFQQGLKDLGQQAYSPSGTIPGTTYDVQATEPRSPLIVLSMLVNIALGLVGFVLLIIVINAGFKWVLNSGNPEKVKQARSAIVNAGIGIVIIMSAFAITYFISKQLELSVRGPNEAGGVQLPDNVQLNFEL